MNKPLHALCSLALVFGLTGPLSIPRAQADETAGEKIQNKADDMKTDAKKSERKAHKKARKAKGTDSVDKDIRDGAKNAGDDISNTATKAKRKVD